METKKFVDIIWLKSEELKKQERQWSASHPKSTALSGKPGAWYKTWESDV